MPVDAAAFVSAVGATPLVATLSETFAAYDVDVGQQAAYSALRRLVGSDYVLFVLLLTAAHSIPFFGLNIFYTAASRALPRLTERFRWLPKRRAEGALVRRCVALVTAYHLLTPLAPLLLYNSAVAHHPTMFSAPVPGVLTCAFQIPLAYVVTDALFYWAHRALHLPFLYQRIHKKHHEFNVSVGWAAEYAHPVEFLLGNVLPVIAGPVLFRYHVVMMCVWVAVAIAGTTWAHSGFAPPLALSNGFHDFHHSNNTGNFGSMVVWDWICGTDGAWRRHLAAQKARKRV